MPESHLQVSLGLACLILLGAASIEKASGAVGETVRYQVTVQESGKKETANITVFVLPGVGKAARWVLAPEETSLGLPVASIAFDAKGRARPALSDPLGRPWVSAFLSWIEADDIVKPEWRKPESTGTAKITVAELRLRAKINVTHNCSPATEETGSVVSLELVEPVTEESRLRLELRSLRFRFELAADGQFSRGTLEHDISRSVGTVTRDTDSRVEIIVLSREALTESETRKIEDEFALRESVARALLPGHDEKQVKDAKKDISKYRAKFPEGKLSGAIVSLEMRLVSAGESVAGLANPDEAAARLIGKIAPDFKLTDLDGNEVTLSDLRGKSVILSFWGYA